MVCQYADIPLNTLNGTRNDLDGIAYLTEYGRNEKLDLLTEL